MLLRSHSRNSLLKPHVVCFSCFDFCFVFCIVHGSIDLDVVSLVIRLIVFLLQFTAYMFIGLPMIARLVPFGLPFTNSITFLLICLLCTLLVFAIKWY